MDPFCHCFDAPTTNFNCPVCMKIRHPCPSCAAKDTEIARMREAIILYGGHRVGCKVDDCSCGFSALRNAIYARAGAG